MVMQTLVSLATVTLRWIGAATVVLTLTAWILSWPLLIIASHHSPRGAVLVSLQAIAAIVVLGLLAWRSDRRWAWLVAIGVVGWCPLLAMILSVVDHVTGQA